MPVSDSVAFRSDPSPENIELRINERGEASGEGEQGEGLAEQYTHWLNG